jgi:nucleoside-diphosphate-sugar epimerase
MRILLTGSTSFIGKHIINLLDAKEYELFHLVRSPKGFVNEFIWDFYGPLPKSLPLCDVVIHLSAYVYFGADLRIAQYNVNSVSTMRLAWYANQKKAYLIYSSMSGVHGSNSFLNENVPINPINHYAMSKYIGEKVIKIFVDNYSILRIGGVYGLDGPTHLGLNIAISDAFHNKKPPELKGAGMARRNYICVQDVARWILTLLKNWKASDKPIQQTLYLAGDQILTIKEYLQTIVDVLLPGNKIRHLESEPAMDMIVSNSVPPFPLIAFRDYLQSLRS